MPAAGASDPDGKVGLSFGEVSGEQIFQQVGHLREEGSERCITRDKCADCSILTRLRRELFHVVRVPQEPNVEKQIEIGRHAEFESERNECHLEPNGPIAEKCRRDPFFERARREAGCIDDDVRPLAQRGEHAPIRVDCFAQGPRTRMRMTAASLAEAAHEQIVGRIQKENVRFVCFRHAIDCGGRIAELVAAAKVERDRHIARGRAFERGYDGIKNNRRQVFDTVEAQILKGFYCLAQARTGEARHEDDAQRTHTMKLFSPERANALIPKLEPLMEELLGRRRELAIKLLESDPALHAPEPRRPRIASARSALPAPRFGELKHEIGRLIYRIESLGCVVKDIDLGLVDFPAMLDDEAVYLCWKLGEPAVAYWHGTDEGFSARKSLA